MESQAETPRVAGPGTFRAFQIPGYLQGGCQQASDAELGVRVKEGCRRQKTRQVGGGCELPQVCCSGAEAGQRAEDARAGMQVLRADGEMLSPR